MNIAKKLDDSGSQEWKHDQCFDIEFNPYSDLPRVQRRDPETGDLVVLSCFGKLSFRYTPCKEDQGKTLVFAYSQPYSYTEMLNDLETAK